MAMQERVARSFTFTWYLENASYCTQKKNEVIKSPAFVVDLIEETKWKLLFYPRGSPDGNYVSIYLSREADSKGDGHVEIYCEFNLITKEGSATKPYEKFLHAFTKGDSRGYPTFKKREEVFSSKQSIFLLRDVLTIRCRIWKAFGVMPRDDQCFARTHIGFQKRTFVWNLNNFSTLEYEQKCTYMIKSLINESPLITLNAFVSGGLSCEEILRFEATPGDRSIKFSTLRLSLVDAAGTRVECNQDELWFDYYPSTKQFTIFLTKKKLMAKKSLYLPNDTLTLHWEWTFSKGVVLEEIEEAHYGCTTLECRTSTAQDVSDQKMVPLSHTSSANLKSVYEEHFLCDVKLKTSSNVFTAHKVILGASSSVFKAMFSRDMEEKDGDCVIIEDLSDDTIRRMLFYIYTSNMEDLTWECASHLYVAADKYAIISLKNICSSYLQENLSSSNACEVLLLSDFHADDDLKTSVQDFILKHDEDIINSDEWKMLMETNLKLAAETLCLRYK